MRDMYWNSSYNQGYEEYAKVLGHSVLIQLPGAKVPPLVRN